MEKLKPNFTQFPNVILDELLSELSDAELKCICYIVRRTYGFQRETDKIALSQFETGLISHNGVRLDYGTGMSKRSIIRALKSLEDRSIIFSDNKYNHKTYGINLNWNNGDKSTLGENGDNISHNGDKSTPIMVTKSNIQKKEKESIQKKDNVTRQASDPMTLNDFIENCRKSPQKHIQIIAEWAEGEQPRHSTYGEWMAFIKRNLRPAKDLSPYPIEKIEKAYQKLQGDIVKKLPNGKTTGFITKYSLETVLKYIDNV